MAKCFFSPISSRKTTDLIFFVRKVEKYSGIIFIDKKTKFLKFDLEQAFEKATRISFNGNSYIFNIRNTTKNSKRKIPSIYENEKENKVLEAVSGRSLVLECVAAGVPTPDIRNIE